MSTFTFRNRKIEFGFAPKTIELGDGFYLHFWYANNSGRGRDNCTIILSDTDKRFAKSSDQLGCLGKTTTSAWSGQVNFSKKVRDHLFRIEVNKKTNFEVIFDNGGGITLQTDDYCHYYDNIEQAAGDVHALLSGAATKKWDGNNAEERLTHDYNDVSNGGYRWYGKEDVENIVKTKKIEEGVWGNIEDFFIALLRVSKKTGEKK
jgi:hypothetical protein